MVRISGGPPPDEKNTQLIDAWCTFSSDSKLAITRAGAVALQELLVCALLLEIIRSGLRARVHRQAP